MKMLLIAFICALISFSGGAQAGDVKAGEVRAQTCLGCHGVPSYANVYPTYHVPKLAGQHAEYIVTALNAYRSGLRKHSTMQAQANVLSDEDINNVAAYFASLPADEPNPSMEVSEEILEKIGTCAACHGTDGSSLAPTFPRIGGQHRDYLYHALKQYKSGEREDPIMLGIVAELSDEDKRFLSVYFSRQSGLREIRGEKFLKR